MSTRKRRRDDEPDDRWRAYEEVIRNLYERERKTLKQVKLILETEHGFPLTPLKTYEEVLRDRFGLRKKLRKADWPIVHQHWQKRNGRKTGVYLNGTRIPEKRAWKEIRRSGAHLHDDSHEKPLPTGIVMRTPSPSESPTPFSSITLDQLSSPLSSLSTNLEITASMSISKKTNIDVNQITSLSTSDPNKNEFSIIELPHDSPCDRLRMCLEDIPWNVWRMRIYSVVGDNVPIQQLHNANAVDQSLFNIGIDPIKLSSLLDSSAAFARKLPLKYFGVFFDPKPFSEELAPHFDAYHFLERAVYLLSNCLVGWDREKCHELFTILFSRIPRGILLVLLFEDLYSTRGAWEELVSLSKRFDKKHAFSLLMDIALARKDWIIPNGHLYLSFAAFFDCTEIVQSLLSIEARPDQAFAEGLGGIRRGLPKAAIVEAVATRNIKCVGLLLEKCDVNRIIYPPTYRNHGKSNFSAFLFQMDDTDELQNQVLDMVLEAGADVDSIWTAEPLSNFSRLAEKNNVPLRCSLSVLDRSFYKSFNLYQKLVKYSRHANTMITRAGICHAAQEGKEKLALYLRSRPTPPQTNIQSFLELILAEQFLLETWDVNTHVALTLINLGVDIRLLSLAEDSSLLTYRVVVAARLYGYEKEIATLLNRLLEKGAVLDADAVEAAVTEEGLGMLPQLALLQADIREVGRLALVSAARLDNFEAVSWLLQQNVDINEGVEEVFNNTIIYLVTNLSGIELRDRTFAEIRPERSASPEMLQYLITCGAALKAFPWNEDPLEFMSWVEFHCARDSFFFDKVRLFLDSGIDPSDPLFSHARLLEACFQPDEQNEQELQAFQLLLERGAPLKPGGVLSCLIAHECGSELIEKVIEAGADIDSYSGSPDMYDHRTPLQAASERGDQGLVSQLLDLGADINQPAAGFVGRTALQAACAWKPKSRKEEACRRTLIRFLIDRGADVNAPGTDFNRRWADRWGQDDEECTALQIAAINCDIELAFLLLDNGAEVNANGPFWCDGDNALDLAATHGRLDMVQLLLSVGAVSRSQGSSRYAGAIRNAEKNRHWAVADLLRRHARSATGMPGTDYLP